MNRAAPQLRRVAKRLIAHEAPTGDPSEAKTPSAFYVVDRLRPHLAGLMGAGGFRALLSRALVLSIAEVPGLSAVRVKADGTLEGLEALHAQLQPAQFLEGRVVLLANLLGLLVAFVGPNLTSRLVGEIWPQMPPEGLHFGNGDHDENAE